MEPASDEVYVDNVTEVEFGDSREQRGHEIMLRVVELEEENKRLRYELGRMFAVIRGILP